MFRISAWLLAAVAVFPGSAVLGADAPQLAAPTAAIRPDAVCFVPPDPCGDRIVALIAGARSSIRLQAYRFTSRPIEHALVDARRRGVDVQMIVDRSNEEHPRGAAGRAARAGIPVWTDDRPSIAHNKVIIIDGQVVIGGSYNYTYAAEHRNTENVTFIYAPTIVAAFAENWQRRREASRAWIDSGAPRQAEAAK